MLIKGGRASSTNFNNASNSFWIISFVGKSVRKSTSRQGDDFMFTHFVRSYNKNKLKKIPSNILKGILHTSKLESTTGNSGATVDEGKTEVKREGTCLERYIVLNINRIFLLHRWRGYRGWERGNVHQLQRNKNTFNSCITIRASLRSLLSV